MRAKGTGAASLEQDQDALRLCVEQNNITEARLSISAGWLCRPFQFPLLVCLLRSKHEKL